MQQHEEMEMNLISDPGNCDIFEHLLSHTAIDENTGEEHEHGHSHEHDHSHGATKVTWRLASMMVLTGGYFIVELVYGFITKSLSLQSDAFHMFSDLAGLVIGLVAHRLSKKGSNGDMTYGWIRTEVVGGLINAVFLLSMCLTIIIEAVQRYISPEPIQRPKDFLIVGAVGLGVNLLGLLIFHDHGDSDNLEGVFLHILSDTLGSVAVILSACAQMWANWSWKVYIDPTLSVLIVLMLVNATWGLFKKTANVVLERCPSKVNLELLKADILKIPNIVSLHELHVWELGKKNFIATLHMVINDKERFTVINKAVTNTMLKHGIYSSTIQTEFTEEYPQNTLSDNSCALASSYGSEKRAFESKPVYKHSIGCQHVNVAEELEQL